LENRQWRPFRDRRETVNTYVAETITIINLGFTTTVGSKKVLASYSASDRQLEISSSSSSFTLLVLLTKLQHWQGTSIGSTGRSTPTGDCAQVV